MIKGCAGLTVFLILATVANASLAPTSSPVPKLRGDKNALPLTTPETLAPNALKSSPIPRLRGSKTKAEIRQNSREIITLMQIAELQRQEEMFRRAAEKNARKNTRTGLATSPVPRLRPSSLSRKKTTSRVIATAQAPRKLTRSERRKQKRANRTVVSRKGSVCGIPSIKGVNAPRINGPGGCGITRPVKITQVAGVSLTREVTLNCTAAKQLDSWVAKSVKPIIGRQGGGLDAVQVIGGYSCRTRNSKRGAKLSEHAKGNAIDIAGFKLRDGTIYSVKRNWRGGRGKSALRKIHKSACGPFGTVLGPNANKYHQSHLHVDIVRYRNGTYCR
jgi:hypothetical protein